MMLSVFAEHATACTIIILGILLFINRMTSHFCKVCIVFINRNKHLEEEDYDE